MLAGQVISLGDSFIISLTGIMVVMLELAFLAVFIQVMSKALNAVVKRKEVLAAAALPVVSSEEEDELAVIMVTVLEETGLSAEDVVFRSVTRVQ